MDLYMKDTHFMTKERLELLFNRHIHQLNTTEEEDELILYVANPQFRAETMMMLNQLVLSVNTDKDLGDERAGAILGKILSNQAKPATRIYTLNSVTRKWLKY